MRVTFVTVLQVEWKGDLPVENTHLKRPCAEDNTTERKDGLYGQHWPGN